MAPFYRQRRGGDALLWITPNLRTGDGAECVVMTMNAKRRRAHDKLAALPGVRAVRRPVRPRRDVAGQAAQGGDQEFDLYYVRTGRKSAHPLVIIPGGPGAASIALYRGFRRRAAAEGLDVIMVEHRGVGMSRHDDCGADLPPEALTIEQVVDDVAAVLDDAQVRQGRHLRHVVRHLHGRRARCAAPGSGARDGPGFAGAVGQTTSMPSARRPAGCCGTATTPRPRTWRPRCANWSTRGDDPGGRAARRGRVRLRGARRVAASTRSVAGRPTDWLWSALGQWRPVPVRTQGALPPRARPGRPDRVPRTQLRRGARRNAARPGRRLPRDRHRYNGIRGRAVRSQSPRCRSSAGRRW